MTDRKQRLTGRMLSGVFVAFMLIASIAPKLLGASVADESLRALGWPDGHTLMIGLIELVCVALYMVPRTSLLGAVLMMAVFGGAMATQIRVGNPLFSHVLFSLYLAAFMWGGLLLRDENFRTLIQSLLTANPAARNN